MRKFIAVILTVILLITCASLLGCSDPVSENELTYNKKYIFVEDVRKPESQQKYFIFYDDGTGVLNEYWDYGSSISHFRVTFKYTIVEEESTLFYFYHSAYYYEDDTERRELTEIRGYFLISEHVIKNANTYVCESYLSEIPNFGK